MDKYTDRKIAIFTDVHSLKEPLEAILEDIEKRNIKEIYSLGDNIGSGPNPYEVMNLLEQHNVISLAGNAEEYITLGTEPFSSYFNEHKEKSVLWTRKQLDEHQIGRISLFPRSIDLIIGGEKLALCHFANDVRMDFKFNSSFRYQKAINNSLSSSASQFLYTNSDMQLHYVRKFIEENGIDNPISRGYISSLMEPLFAGKRVTFYDGVIQGHVHFKIYDEYKDTKFYTLRAAGIGYRGRNYNDDIDTASYVILHEKKDNKGFDLEEVLVKYDRGKMISSILSSDNPDNKIKHFVNIK